MLKACAGAVEQPGGKLNRKLNNSKEFTRFLVNSLELLSFLLSLPPGCFHCARAASELYGWRRRPSATIDQSKLGALSERCALWRGRDGVASAGTENDGARMWLPCRTISTSQVKRCCVANLCSFSDSTPGRNKQESQNVAKFTVAPESHNADTNAIVSFLFKASHSTLT